MDPKNLELGFFLGWYDGPFFFAEDHRNWWLGQEMIDLAPGPQINGYFLYQQKQTPGHGDAHLLGRVKGEDPSGNPP